ncbi:MAG: hypothetical protein H7231_04010, partial [Rhodoferax sp.]|nr:hypothetical protein [Actinomycetota bacterium]
MADLGATLLRAALGYAQARVVDLLEPDDLAAALGVPIPADVLDAVVAHLAQAQTETDQLAAALAGPVTLDNGRTAAGHLTAAVTAVRAAAAGLGADDGAHLTTALSAAPDPAGLVGRLGLGAPPGLQVGATSLRYTLAS